VLQGLLMFCSVATIDIYDGLSLIMKVFDGCTFIFSAEETLLLSFD
jgi:hypothetical protein